MSHFITVPINENGIIIDDYIRQEVQTACSPRFGTTDIFLYSHGWWTTAVAALTSYNRFSTDFTGKTLEIGALTPPPLTRLPTQAFGIGLHWPSTFTENPISGLANALEAATYYTMEKRADTIGQHALYSILRMAIDANTTAGLPPRPLRFHLLGHSFGCKVVCSALQQISKERETGEIAQALDINVVLLQAAFSNNEFEDRKDYALIADAGLDARVLLTRSNLDIALGTQFPRAKMIDLFGARADRVALGYGGPTPAAQQRFGSYGTMTVAPRFTHGDMAGLNQRLLCADITPLHAAHTAYPADSFGGHHSDIYLPEIYELIAGFLFA